MIGAGAVNIDKSISGSRPKPHADQDVGIVPSLPEDAGSEGIFGAGLPLGIRGIRARDAMPPIAENLAKPLSKGI